MLTKTRRKDGSICHKHKNGDFDCSGSLPSTVMAIPKIDSSEETIFKWTNLPVLIHSSGKTVPPESDLIFPDFYTVWVYTNFLSHFLGIRSRIFYEFFEIA